MLLLMLPLFIVVASSSVMQYEELSKKCEVHFNFLRQLLRVEDSVIIKHSVYSVLEEMLSGKDTLSEFGGVSLPLHHDLHSYVDTQRIIADAEKGHFIQVLTESLSTALPPAPLPDPFLSIYQPAISDFNDLFKAQDREKLFSWWKDKNAIINTLASFVEGRRSKLLPEIRKIFQGLMQKIRTEGAQANSKKIASTYLEDLVPNIDSIPVHDPINFYVKEMPNLAVHIQLYSEVFVCCIRVLTARGLDPKTNLHVLWTLFLHVTQALSTDFALANPRITLDLTLKPLHKTLGFAVQHVFKLPLGTPLFCDIEMVRDLQVPFVTLCHLLFDDGFGWLSRYILPGDYSPAAIMGTLMPNIILFFAKAQRDLNSISNSVTLVTSLTDEFVFLTFAAKAKFWSPWADKFSDICPDYDSYLTLCLLYRVFRVFMTLQHVSDFIRFLPKDIPQFESNFALPFYHLIVDHILPINFKKHYDYSLMCDIKFEAIPFSSDFDTAVRQCNTVLAVILDLHRYFIQFKLQPQLIRHFVFPSSIIEHVLKHNINQ